MTEVIMVKRLLACFSLLALLLLTACSSVSCAKDEIPFVHHHSYVEKHIDGDCLTYGYTTYQCHCGDRYTIADTELGAHRYVSSAANDRTGYGVLLDAVSTDGIRGTRCTICGDFLSYDTISRVQEDLPPITPRK